MKSFSLLIFSLAFLNVGFASSGYAQNENDLREQVEDYFDFTLEQGDEFASQAKILRILASTIATQVHMGSRKEVEQKIALLVEVAATEMTPDSFQDPIELFRLLVLEDETKQITQTWNENIRHERERLKLWSVVGSVGIGATVGAIVFGRLNGPDWAGLMAALAGGAVGLGLTSLGITASGVGIDQLESFRGIDPASFEYSDFGNEIFGVNYDSFSPNKDVELYLSGKLSLEETLEKVLGKNLLSGDLDLKDFLSSWATSVKTMENFISGLSDAERIVAISRALNFQVVVSKEINRYNLAVEDSMRKTNLNSAGAGSLAGAGLAFVFYRSYGGLFDSTKIGVMIFSGILGSSIGYLVAPATIDLFSSSDDPVSVEDFSILDFDRLID